MASQTPVAWEHVPDDSDELMTGEAVALDLRPTGFALRAAGAIIDVLVYFGSYIAISIGIFTLALRINAEDAVFGILSVVALVFCLVVAPTAVELLTRGKSLGRLAVGARIVRDDGGAITLRHALIRALMGLLEIYLMGPIALTVGLLNRRSKRLGDLLAGTYSQYERVAPLPTAVFGIPSPLAAWAQTADVARMPDGLSRRIAHFLAQAPKFEPARRVYLARALAAEASVYVSPVPVTDAELFLAAITVLRRTRETAAHELEARRLQQLEPALRGLPHAFPDRG